MMTHQDTPAVAVAHLRKSYGPVVAVDDVSFSVAEGEIFGILGPNGAGKTTTVECVTGLREPDAGSDPAARPGPAGPTGTSCTRSSACSSRRARSRPSSGSARSSTCTGPSTGAPPTSAT